MDTEMLTQAVGDLDEDTVYKTLEEVMAAGGGDALAAMGACQKGMDVVGDRFESQEYFVGDLIYAGEIMQRTVEILKPALASGDEGSGGKMIICTVKDDLHDIGKNIVKSMLEASGIEVIDLGIDVPPDAVVENVRSQGVGVVALSGVLTLALDSMRDTVTALKTAGQEDVKVIIGGAPVSAETCKVIGADAWAHNPQDTVRTCQSWM